jgi:hypothetical protein
MAPALIGMGLVKGYAAKRKRAAMSTEDAKAAGQK